MTDRSAEVLDLMSGRTGHFLLESGHHGELWLELDAMFFSPATLDPLVADLAARLRPHGPEVVCGPLVGGALLAQLVAARLGAAFCYTERISTGDGLYAAAYGMPAPLAARMGGKRVAVVDDVVNAGSALRATLTALAEAGAVSVAVGAMLTLGSMPAAVVAEAGLPIETLANRPNELWERTTCPLCAAGEPLDVP